MNILFFLKPKATLAYVQDNQTIRQALEIMEYHRYTSVPIISKDGFYVGSLTEGDILWHLKNKNFPTLYETEEMNITEVKRKVDYKCVNANSKMEDIIERSMEQNFVPVVDDKEHFIGIITRKDIIKYCYDKSQEGGCVANKSEEGVLI